MNEALISMTRPCMAHQGLQPSIVSEVETVLINPHMEADIKTSVHILSRISQARLAEPRQVYMSPRH